MTEPQSPEDTWEVVIPDYVMAQLDHLPPEAVDDLAAAIARIRENPGNTPGARPMTPFPIEYDTFSERVYVPATRSVSYLRNAVGDISPRTVAAYDTELREDVTGETPEARIHALRCFLLRWIEYISVFGDPDTGRHLAQADTAQEYGLRFAKAMERVVREEFPDAAEGGLAVRVSTDGRRWTAVCPITMIRVSRPTEHEAGLALRSALMELISGY